MITGAWILDFKDLTMPECCRKQGHLSRGKILFSVVAAGGEALIKEPENLLNQCPTLPITVVQTPTTGYREGFSKDYRPGFQVRAGLGNIEKGRRNILLYVIFYLLMCPRNLQY